MSRIGFDVYELNDDEAWWVEYSVREQIPVLENLIKEQTEKGLSLYDYPEILQHLKNAYRKIEEKNNSNGVHNYENRKGTA